MPNPFPNYRIVQLLKEQYPPETRVELIETDDLFAPPARTRGTVKCVDDAGQIMVRWDTGSGLSLIPGVDRFKIVNE